MKHTAGPWFLGSSNRDVSDLAVCTIYLDPHESSTIARLMAKGGKEYQNAKLIAAAPDLLEFAQLVVNGDGASAREIMEKGRAAIEKATGETK